jgi:protein-S-isoprenylcysteine O-methyltransferase Ste14
MTKIFIIISLIVYVIFFIYVFDIRNKKGMEPLVSNIWTIIMKVFAGSMLVLYAYFVTTTHSVQTINVITLVLTSIGTGLVVAAKVTLGRYHTWAGYHLKETAIVSHGIYSRLRHPLYTGVILFEIGVLLLIIPRMAVYPSWMTIAVIGIFAYMISFNIYLAKCESKEMKKKFDIKYDKYAARVRAFIPIHKNTKTVESCNNES